MTSTELEPVRGEIERTAPYLPMDVDDARLAMDRYQAICAAVLTDDDWIGRPGEPGSFIKRSGWDKQATFYGVSVELLGDTILERDADGKLIRASARARAIARDGRARDAGGACGRNEPRFASGSGRQKIEHDLPATAETRAVNRAIASLIGFGQVSAEEVDADVRAGSTAATQVPEWAEDIPDDALERLEANLDTIVAAGGVTIADRPAVVVGIGDAITTYCEGVFPAACARLAHLLAQTVTAAAATEPDSTEPEPVPDSPAAAAAPAGPGADDDPVAD